MNEINKLIHLFLKLFGHCMQDLVPWPGIEPVPSALEA